MAEPTGRGLHTPGAEVHGDQHRKRGKRGGRKVRERIAARRRDQLNRLYSDIDTSAAKRMTARANAEQVDGLTDTLAEKFGEVRELRAGQSPNDFYGHSTSVIRSHRPGLAKGMRSAKGETGA